MNLNREIGVWIDYTHAHLIDLSKGPVTIETVYSEKETEVRFLGEHGTGTKLGNNRATNSENHMQNRANELKQHYFKTLEKVLLNYDNIYIFGPGSAKDEFHNQLKSDKQFAGKIVALEAAENMTENQMIARVKRRFIV